MSSARDSAMSKIQASIDGYSFEIDRDTFESLTDEEVQLDEAASVQSSKDVIEAERAKQAAIKTDADVQRLEDAKRKASSNAVKAEIDEEIQRIKLAKIQQEEEERNRTVTDIAADQIEQGQRAVDRGLEIARETWDGVGRVAIPGSIFLPIAVLLIFFFLIIPVNGHTRIEWLILALTGNAQIGNLDVSQTQAVDTTPTITSYAAMMNGGAV